jgi:hypothetical protein
MGQQLNRKILLASIVELQECIAWEFWHGSADTVELLEAGQSINWSGRNWQITRVRLRRDGQCDIDLLVPTLADDPRGTAFSRSLGDLRPCRDHTCSGATLITALRQRVERI